MHQRRIEITARVHRKVFGEIIRHFIDAFHAQPRAGVTRVAAALVDRRALQHDNARTALLRRYRRSKARDTAADNDDVTGRRWISHEDKLSFKTIT